MEPPAPSRLLRKAAVVARVALSGTTIGRLARAGQFPQAIRTSTRAVAWREADIEAWIAARAAASRR